MTRSHISHLTLATVTMLLTFLLIATGVVAQQCPPPGVSGNEPWIPQPPSDRNISSDSTQADIDGTSDVSKWVLDFHNQFRAQFGSPPLVWNSSLAQNEVTHTQSCEWKHWGNDNLAFSQISIPNYSFEANQGMEGWANEWRDHSNGSQFFDHFTAMLWRPAVSVGCAWHFGCTGDVFGEGWESTMYFTCKYAPVVNLIYDNSYSENVGNFIGCDSQQAIASVESSLSASATATARRQGAPTMSSVSGNSSPTLASAARRRAVIPFTGWRMVEWLTGA